MKKLLIFLAFLLLVGGSASAYTIKKGDTLWGLFGPNWKQVAEQNGITDPRKLQVGQELVVGSEPTLGAGYVPVTGYSSRTTSYISSSASTIPVASTKDKAGNQIVLTNISSSSTVKVYMNLAAGQTDEEPIYCTGVTATSWTGCVRGLAFQGDSEAASSTLQKAHNAGTSIIITNIGQFYNQYVSVDGAQQVNGVKTFTSFPEYYNSVGVPTTNGQMATKYYVDNVGAGGFTAANVSTTLGLYATGSVPEKLGINASSTGGLEFSSSGALQVKSGNGIKTDLNGTQIDGSDSIIWTNNQNFSATTTMATTTMTSSTITNLNIGSYSASTLIGGSSSTLHFHPSVNGIYTTSTVNTTASVTIPHTLGVTPKKIRIYLTSTYTSTNLRSNTSSGVWNDLNGAGATTNQSAIATQIDPTANTVVVTSTTSNISIYSQAGANRYITLSAVNGTGFTLTFAADGGASTATVVLLWEAEY